MIPEHFQGKNAEQIANGVRKKWEHRLNAYDNEDYIKELEKLLVLAVKDALMNADGKVLCNNDYGLMGSEAEVRAIAFLNVGVGVQ